MKFYCIVEDHSERSKIRSSLLEKACKKRNIEFVELLPEKFDYTSGGLEKGALLFRATPGNKSRILEKHLTDESTTTFYNDNHFGISEKGGSFFYNEKQGLPIVKTIPDFLSNKENLKKYADLLGGFPVVVKITGGTQGVGVLKIDSMESLKSFCDFLDEAKLPAIMRQYIKHKEQGRLIVVGNRVVATHVNYPTDDFRTNVGPHSKRKYEAKAYAEDIKNLAVKAVESVGIEFGGVDVLFDQETDKAYIAEVNFPCAFPLTQDLTGIDIAGAMVDYLIKKSK